MRTMQRWSPAVDRSWPILRSVGAAAAALVAIAAWFVATGPGQFTVPAGRSTAVATASLLAGISLAVAGAGDFPVRRAGRLSVLASLAAIAWSTPAFAGWSGGPALVRSTAPLVAAFVAPLVLDLVDTSEALPRLTRARLLVATMYIEISVAAIVVALTRDPYLDPDCLANCSANPFLVRARPAVASGAVWVDRIFTSVACIVFAVMCVVAIVDVRARGRAAVVGLPAVGFALAAGVRSAVLAERGVDDPGHTANLAAFLVSAVMLILLGAGVTWCRLRWQRQRRAVARIVSDLAAERAAGALQDALATALEDSGLRIAYPVGPEQLFLDGDARAVPPALWTGGERSTTLTGAGRTIAVIFHTVPHPVLERALGPAARLHMENERLRVEELFRLAEIRAAQARIVEAGDTERRRLERDLHDGAQELLLVLLADVLEARDAARRSGFAACQAPLDDAVTTVETAISDLRRLAQGIFPPSLTAVGLAGALRSLAVGTDVALEFDELPDSRYPATVEATGYFLVVEATADAAKRGASYVAASCVQDGDTLVLTIADDGRLPRPVLRRAVDRVGALGGSMTIERDLVRAELPCALS
jgi:signal transduction histidine kinase